MEGKVHFLLNLLWANLANSHNITLNPITVFTDSKSPQMVEQIDGKVEHRTSRSEKSPGYMSNYIWNENIQWCESTKALLFHMYNLRDSNSLFLYTSYGRQVNQTGIHLAAYRCSHTELQNNMHEISLSV